MYEPLNLLKHKRILEHSFYYYVFKRGTPKKVLSFLNELILDSSYNYCNAIMTRLHNTFFNPVKKKKKIFYLF